MGVGSVTSMGSMSSAWMTKVNSTDVKSKNIENKIAGIQQQMRKLSSEDELSVDEKVNERKKQQQEISSLNTELKRHQDEFLKSQKREIMIAELQKDEEPAKEKASETKVQTDGANEKDITAKETKAIDSNGETAMTSAGSSTQQAVRQGTIIFKNSDGIVILKGEMNQDEIRGVDANKTNEAENKEEDIVEKEEKKIDEDITTGLTDKEIYEIVSADASAQQINRQERVIAKIKGDIVVLKGEMSQDERHGVNTDKKQAELEKLEKAEERARKFQSSVLGEANKIRRSTTRTKLSGTEVNIGSNLSINSSRLSKEEAQSSEQKFYVSLGR